MVQDSIMMTNRRNLMVSIQQTPSLQWWWFVPLIIKLIIISILSNSNCSHTVYALSMNPNRNTNPKSDSTTTDKTSKDYIVHDLASIEPAFQLYDGTMYSGLIPTTSSRTTKTSSDDGELMFWLFEPTNPTYTDTLVIWFNGGPGCSSFGGMMFENGPVTIPRYPAGYYGIDPNVSLSYNPYSWTHTTSIMYIEQPQGGTGFSQSGTVPNNESDISRSMYHFLQNFYTIFDNNNNDRSWRSKQLYLFGESYAGMFVPSIAHYIYQQNKEIEKLQNEPSKDATKRLRISLAGIALGNGWMDVQVQGPAVIDYAWWHGMIDTSTKKALHHEWLNCRPDETTTTTTNNVQQHTTIPKHSLFHTFTVPDECGIMGAVLQAAGMNVVDWGTPNAYDVTTWDPYLMLDVPSGSIHQFFNNPNVQEALHVVPPRPWVECMPGAGRRRKLQQRATSGQPQRQLTKLRLPGELLLDHDEPLSVVPYVADLLDKAGIRVLVYNGDRDMTTNSQGSELLLDSMVWDGAAGWSNINDFERGVWLPKVGHQLGGYVKQYQNLQFLVVYNSGHLVPFNQDEIALELVTRFLGNVSFLDRPLPKFHIQRKHPPVSEKVQGVQVNPYRSGYHYIRDIVGASLCILLGSIIGFIASRRSLKDRNLYQAIPNK